MAEVLREVLTLSHPINPFSRIIQILGLKSVSFILKETESVYIILKEIYLLSV